MIDPTTIVVGAAVRVGAPLALGHVLRVYREKQAASGDKTPDSDLLRKTLDETFARITSGQADAAWWSKVLNAIGRPLVSPDWIATSHVQEWLSIRSVRDDLRAEARSKLLRKKASDTSRRKRLRVSYSKISEERESLADGVIEGIVAVLVAGYVAAIPHALEPIAGLVQASTSDLREGIQSVDGKLDRVLASMASDPVVVKTHSQLANARLRAMLKCRMFNPDGVRESLRELVQVVLGGELKFADQATRQAIKIWLARLTTSPKTVALAEGLLTEIRKEFPGVDLRIPDAFVEDAHGRGDAALETLSKIESALGRTVYFALLRKNRGAEAAISWLLSAVNLEDHKALTEVGWYNVCVALCELGRFKEAAEALAGITSMWESLPDLAFLDGVVAVGLLLPEGARKSVLEMRIFDPSIRPERGSSAEALRARARASFRAAKEFYDNLGELAVKRMEAADAWMLWLGLTDPSAHERARSEGLVQEAMSDGKKAVEMVPFVVGFDIKVDFEPLRRHLSHKLRVGSLDPGETLAEVMLAEATLESADFAGFIDAHFSRLVVSIPKIVLVGKRIEALASAADFAGARIALEANEGLFKGNRDFDRLRNIIGISAGENVREGLEQLYRDTSSLIDLRNLVR